MQQLDIRTIYRLLLSRWRMLLCFALIGAIMFGCIAMFFMEEKYSSGVSMYVSSLTEAAAAQGNDTTYSSLVSAEWLVLTYVDILQDRSTMEQVVPKLSRNVSIQQLTEMISVRNISETAMMRITASANDPTFAAEVCNAMAKVAPDVLRSVVGAGSVKVIGEALPGSKTSPNVPKMAIIGLLVGLIAAVAIVIIRRLLDNTVKTAAELKERLQVPVLGVVPAFDHKPSKSRSKGGKQNG